MVSLLDDEYIFLDAPSIVLDVAYLELPVECLHLITYNLEEIKTN
jgi:hypothetical protein